MLLEKTFTFEASHQIPNHPGKCARLHGHSWRLKVAIEGPVSEMTGMVMDYYDIKAQVQPIVDRLDHRHLGHGIVETTVTGIPVGYIPTSENMLLWIADELPTTFPWTYLEINETCTSSAILSHEEWLYTRVSHLFGKEDDNVETSN